MTKNCWPISKNKHPLQIMSIQNLHFMGSKKWALNLQIKSLAKMTQKYRLNKLMRRDKINHKFAHRVKFTTIKKIQTNLINLTPSKNQ